MKKNKQPSVTLYIHAGCPFCQKVLDYLEEMNKTLPIKNLKAHPEFQKELLSLTGKNEHPCLVVDGDAIHESKTIILWLEEHKKHLEDTHYRL